ncbi:hypothetical protein [Pseudomonas sp. BTN1]|uniref:hypothetical protein n=1 Tax=Pseudomonas sp. BTN1 TaxID=1750647 RepID=UPI000938C56F|nr:hypothetical protein [Pseudomonas sp. BTN1]OKO48933.1 hypothetical protein BMH52_08720 [Pseudomonas sp. BTN1]
MSMPINQFLNASQRPDLGDLSYPLPSSTENVGGPNNKIIISHYGQTAVVSHRDPGAVFNERGFHPASTVKINTGNSDDLVYIKKFDNRLTAIVNGAAIKLDIDESNPSGNQAKLFITTYGGKDTVIVDPDVKTDIHIDTGADDDQVETGGGHAQVYLGNGADIGKLGAGGGELYGQDGDDELHGGTAGSAHLVGGSGSNTMMSNLQRSDDQATWIVAQGENDKIRSRSFTTIKIESQSAYVLVNPEVPTHIDIAENAGNTETVALWAGNEEENVDVTYTGRQDDEKDIKRTQQGPRSESEENALWPN